MPKGGAYYFYQTSSTSSSSLYSTGNSRLKIFSLDMSLSNNRSMVQSRKILTRLSSLGILERYTVLQIHHATKPCKCNPNMVAIADLFPIIATWPLEENSNFFFCLFFIIACKLYATTLAPASALCAVGGYGLLVCGFSK